MSGALDFCRGNHEHQRLLMAVAATGVAGLIAFQRVSTNANKKKPPMASAGLLETIGEITGGKMHEFLIAQFERCGGIFRLPLPGLVVVANPEDARAIYKDPLTTKPHAIYKAVDSMTSGPNIVTISGGDAWHHRRKSINPAFAPKLVKRMNAVAVEKADTWVEERLLPSIADHGVVSFDPGMEMILLTIAVICQAAFDYAISDEESKDILQAMRDCVEEFSIKTMINPLRQVGTWVLPERRNAFNQAAKLKLFAWKVMDQYRANPSPTKDTVIDLIMKNRNYKEDSERVSDVILLLFAGHDTTGYTMAFALRELAKNPEEQHKLRESLQSAEDNATSSTSLLKAVLNETMRMHPASPLSAIKQLGQDFVSKDGYYVAKGSVIFLAQVAQGRDPSLFPNPHQFQPSRWLDENATEPAKQACFPFSLGNRNCVGQPLANAELNSVLPKLIRQFEFAIEEKGIIEAQGTLRLTGCRLKATKLH